MVKPSPIGRTWLEYSASFLGKVEYCQEIRDGKEKSDNKYENRLDLRFLKPLKRKIC